MSVVFKVLLK